jgi:hypothetical protein
LASSPWINEAFLPQSVLPNEINQILACKFIPLILTFSKLLVVDFSDIITIAQTIILNTQITNHCNKKNALLFDANFFFGIHLGGKFLLYSLGVECHGLSLHCYSFHGPLRILLGGQILFPWRSDGGATSIFS